MTRPQDDSALTRLTSFFALFRSFQAVIHRVSDQVNHWLSQPLDDGSVEPGFLTVNPKLNLFARLIGQVANQSGESAEKLFHGNHSKFKRLVTHLTGHALKAFQGKAI